MGQRLEKVARLASALCHAVDIHIRLRLNRVEERHCGLHFMLAYVNAFIADWANPRNPIAVLSARISGQASSTGAAPPPLLSRFRIVLEPADRRLPGLAKGPRDPLHPPQYAQHVSGRNFLKVSLGKSTANEFGKQVRKAANVFESDRRSAAEIVGPDADMVEARRSRRGGQYDRRPVPGSLSAQSRAWPPVQRTGPWDRPRPAPFRKGRASGAASRASGCETKPGTKVAMTRPPLALRRCRTSSGALRG